MGINYVTPGWSVKRQPGFLFNNFLIRHLLPIAIYPFASLVIK